MAIVLYEDKPKVNPEIATLRSQRQVAKSRGGILRQAQNEREKELDENSEGLRMTR